MLLQNSPIAISVILFQATYEIFRDPLVTRRIKINFDVFPVFQTEKHVFKFNKKVARATSFYIIVMTFC